MVICHKLAIKCIKSYKTFFEIYDRKDVYSDQFNHIFMGDSRKNVLNLDKGQTNMNTNLT